MPRPPSETTQELLEGVLEGQQWQFDDLERIRDEHGEDQWLDYKSGLLFDDKPPKDVKTDLQHDAAAFANAMGGLLVLGVNENENNEIDGCPLTVGSRPIGGWIQQVLSLVKYSRERQAAIAGSASTHSSRM